MKDEKLSTPIAWGAATEIIQDPTFDDCKWRTSCEGLVDEHSQVFLRDKINAHFAGKMTIRQVLGILAEWLEADIPLPNGLTRNIDEASEPNIVEPVYHMAGWLVHECIESVLVESGVQFEEFEERH